MFKKIILGVRQTGKSTYLIKKCSEDNGSSVIVCPNKPFCDSIMDIAKQQKCNIPMPITFREFIAGEYNPDITKFYFDELQLSLQNLAYGREINTVVIGGEDLDVTLLHGSKKLNAPTRMNTERIEDATNAIDPKAIGMEPGCLSRNVFGHIVEGKLLCKDCRAMYDSYCVCNATAKVYFPVHESEVKK
jgi:hypothetical protein